MNAPEYIQGFSPHLFWDTRPEKVDPDLQASWLIHRVLVYGLLEDWRRLREKWTLDEIVEKAKKMRDLDPKSMSFLSALSGVPEDQFACYIPLQSKQSFWTS